MCSVVYALDLYSCVYMYEVITVNKNDDGSDGTAHMLPGTDSASDLGYVLDTSNICTNDDSDNVQCPIPAYIDDFMTKAYGGTLLISDGDDRSSQWCQGWEAVVKLNARHYVLPGGLVGQNFVDMMTAELNHLTLDHYPAERCLVFGFVILQKDRMIKKGSDIRRLLEKHLTLWQEDKFDLLVQEATQCDHLVHFIYPRSKNFEDHVIRVFSKLMLEGNVRAAVHLVTEHAGGGVLDPDAIIPYGQNGSIFVRDALLRKHPEPCVPPTSVLPCCDALSLFEDVKVCVAHVQAVACMIQGGAGPGGCDAAHWCDILLCYGAHSGYLRDSVAAVACRLHNSITPWDDVQL